MTRSSVQKYTLPSLDCIYRVYIPRKTSTKSRVLGFLYPYRTRSEERGRGRRRREGQEEVRKRREISKRKGRKMRRRVEGKEGDREGGRIRVEGDSTEH